MINPASDSPEEPEPNQAPTEWETEGTEEEQLPDLDPDLKWPDDYDHGAEEAVPSFDDVLNPPDPPANKAYGDRPAPAGE